MATEYVLKPPYDKAQSFCGKAKVIEEYGTLSLISYKSCICQLKRVAPDDYDVVIYNVTDYYGKSLTSSSTSLRHLKEFLLQNGFKADSKAQIMKDYIIADGGQTDGVR